MRQNSVGTKMRPKKGQKRDTYEAKKTQTGTNSHYTYISWEGLLYQVHIILYCTLDKLHTETLVHYLRYIIFYITV